MSYEYDVFISYRRHVEWTPWTRDHFVRLLDAYLTQDLGRPPSIFIDRDIHPGSDWPTKLGQALARSRVFIPAFTRDYFTSDWCLHELELMYGRLLDHTSCDLVIPVLFHDGDYIPDVFSRIQVTDLREYRNTEIQRRTPLYERFAEAIKKLSPHVAAAVENAPQFQADWEDACVRRFDNVYKASINSSACPAITRFTLKTPNNQIPLPRPVYAR